MAEKYLKAVLQEHAISIPKTHSLAELLAICMKIDPAYQYVQSDINLMDGYAVQFRYPGLSADKSEAQAAFKSAMGARTFFRLKLGLPE
jgi:HEPN domain-containing protein